MGRFSPSSKARPLRTPTRTPGCGESGQGNGADKRSRALIGPRRRPGRYLEGQVPTPRRALRRHPASGRSGQLPLPFRLCLDGPGPGAPSLVFPSLGHKHKWTQPPGQGLQRATRPSWLWGEDVKEWGTGLGQGGMWPPEAGFLGRNPASAMHQLSCLGKWRRAPAFPALVFPSVNRVQSSSPRQLGGFRERRDTKP